MIVGIESAIRRGTKVSPQEYEAQVAAFIRAKGVTRCPTAFAAPAHGTTGAVDRAALQERAACRELIREERERQATARRLGASRGLSAWPAAAAH